MIIHFLSGSSGIYGKKRAGIAWGLGCLFILYAAGVFAQTKPLSLQSDKLQLQWQQTPQGWKVNQVLLKQQDGRWQNAGHPSGEYTILYAAQKPDTVPVMVQDAKGNAIQFPEPQYRYIIPIWREATSPVEMNVAGDALHFYPSVATGNHHNINFEHETPLALVKATWSLDESSAQDVHVSLTLKAKKAGYYSIATPALMQFDKDAFQWAAVPGVFQGNALNPNFVNAFAYGQGVPDKPVVVRERTASALTAFVTAQNGVTHAVTAVPGTGRNPWAYDKKTQEAWQLGLSVINRKKSLTPTLYHPVLGEQGSFLQEGQELTFSFVYTLQASAWYLVYKHVVNDIYQFPDFLHLKTTRRSLTDRLMAMHQYVLDDSTSKWHTYRYKGVDIGAQDYLGGVYGSNKDALKNADYGAMWMLASITGDTLLSNTRLPYARNFKLVQQAGSGAFAGAAAGQYYLHKTKTFTEEWGPYTEPIGTTYYMLMDVGNMLLFQPADTALQQELRKAADKLLQWMLPDGRWQVAYDNTSGKPMFTDVQDLRPTFYGLLIAYRLLKEAKYLNAAKQAADWFIVHAVNKGYFLGVCGDTRFAPDFATGQSVQALLDLYDVTKEVRYKKAALNLAHIYMTSVYTHPIPNRDKKMVNGIEREDQQIAQAGLSFEHGGVMGSANHRGPILLASHAGMFVRLFGITGDSLYLHMARAAALGRDAFVDSATGVASYYWDVMNKGAGPYPHHAWWQIGWIMDYLISEAAMRSNGAVHFAAGFITPKVGPHKTYGFTKGKIAGHAVSLLLRQGLVQNSNPYIDYFTAIDEPAKKLFVVLLNNDDEAQQAIIQLNASVMPAIKTVIKVIDLADNQNGMPIDGRIALKPYGIKILEVHYQ
jgi:hypothetical protein